MQPDWPEDVVEVGRIVDAWGIKGWVKVLPYSNDPQALFSSKRWFLAPPTAPIALTLRATRQLPAAKTSTWPNLLRVSQAKEHGDVVVAQIHDITDRSGAEALKGGRIFVSRASFPTAETDEYYWVDLIGLAVFNRQNQALGVVQDLIDTGAHSVLRIQADPLANPASTQPQAKSIQRLIPFVAAYIDSVDLPAKRIQVDWQPEWDSQD